ncbi:MAG: T9SS type A sorting domain-containing protein [Flavobacteriales bacterium]
MFKTHVIRSILALGIVVFSCANIIAQKQSSLYLQNGHAVIEKNERSCIDTLTEFFQGSTVSLYTSTNGGFVSGNNGFGDSEKLQLYNHFENYSILGAWVWFGAKTYTSGSAESGIEVIVVHTDSTASSFPPFLRGPSDSILGNQFYPINNIIASDFPWLGLNYIEFDPPVLIRDGYALGVRFTSLAEGDTLGIISSADGEPNQARRSWERWDGIYGTMIDNWGLNIDMAIFPIVDCELNSMQNISQNVIQVFPNPAVDMIQLKLPKTGDFSYCIFDAGGKNLMNGELKGINESALINVSNLKCGSYTVFVYGINGVFYSRFTKHIR